MLGFKSRNHPQQVVGRDPHQSDMWLEPRQVDVECPRSSVDDRETASELFAPLHERFLFSIDVAASEHNAKLERFYTVEDDGLKQSWAGERVWCNPPYSDIEPWVRKAQYEIHTEAQLVVMIVPANRTEQSWWQDTIERTRDRPESRLRVEFIRGRTRFIAPGKYGIGPNERPPFGCCLLIWISP